MTPTRTVATLAATAVLATLTAVSPADAAHHKHVNLGVSIHALNPNLTPQRQNQLLGKLEAIGVDHVREAVSWRNLQTRPYPGTGRRYNPSAVADLDGLMRRIAAHHMTVLVVPMHTPGWANGGQDSTVPPTDNADYMKLNRWLVRRYPIIDQVELWNEWNLQLYWSGTTAQYASLMCAGYAGVQAADPSVTVLTGGVASVDFGHVTALLDALDAMGHPTCYDQVAVHPYTHTNNPLLVPPTPNRHYFMSQVHLHRILVNRGYPARVEDTEFGWSTHSNEGIDNPDHWGVTQRVQRKFYRLAVAQMNRWPWIAHRAYGFTASDAPAGTGNNVNNNTFGWFRLPGLAPKLITGWVDRYMHR